MPGLAILTSVANSTHSARGTVWLLLRNALRFCNSLEVISDAPEIESPMMAVIMTCKAGLMTRKMTLLN